eukprot:Rhum_TRINITY_DN4565_c0_g1::Rhum_TRINITY_DN4565_c0_g1_i1::g.14855::m.14855
MKLLSTRPSSSSPPHTPSPRKRLLRLAPTLAQHGGGVLHGDHLCPLRSLLRRLLRAGRRRLLHRGGKVRGPPLLASRGTREARRDGGGLLSLLLALALALEVAALLVFVDGDAGLSVEQLHHLVRERLVHSKQLQTDRQRHRRLPRRALLHGGARRVHGQRAHVLIVREQVPDEGCGGEDVRALLLRALEGGVQLVDEVVEAVLGLGGQQQRRRADAAHAPCAPDAVHVDARVVGRLEVQDVVHLAHVDAEGALVGGQQDALLVAEEVLEALGAVGLGDAGVQAVRGHLPQHGLLRVLADDAEQQRNVLERRGVVEEDEVFLAGVLVQQVDEERERLLRGAEDVVVLQVDQRRLGVDHRVDLAVVQRGVLRHVSHLVDDVVFLVPLHGHDAVFRHLLRQVRHRQAPLLDEAPHALR